MSKSKSKTPRTSKSSATKRPDARQPELAGATLAVGHEPSSALSPQDEKLFRAFQSNLLSLISHELRTPLMGVLNSLSLLEEDPSGESGIPRDELVRMARQNADRLHRTLSALLDLAQLESGVFHARLREIDFAKIVRNRVDAVARELRDSDVRIDVQADGKAPLLADPQKVSRAVELCLQAIVPRAREQSRIGVKVSGSNVGFRFRIKGESLGQWEQAWLQAKAGFQGGVASPSSAFGGVLQSEEAFLTRQEEGLGSELLLVHEIMRLHQGRFTEEHAGTGENAEVLLTLEFSQVSSEQGIRAVLTSRAYDVSTELATVALVLMDSPDFRSREGELERFAAKLKEHLFRASDAVYPLPERRQIALVLDDCKAEDVPGLVGRLKKSLASEGGGLRLGWAHCPSDSLDPSRLFDLALTRIGT